MWVGLLENLGAKLETDEERKELLKEAIYWANDATKWAREIQFEIFDLLLIQQFPDLRSETIVFELEDDFVGRIDSQHPLFIEDCPENAD